jgi:hypothetical protein
LAEVLGPSSLSAIEKFGGGKIFEIFVIRDDVDWCRGTLEIVAPDSECFEDSIKFFVVDVVVELGRVEFLGVECYRVNFS